MESITLLKKTLLQEQSFIDKSEKFYVISATLDKRGRIVAIGRNNPIHTHPVMQEYAVRAKSPEKSYLHAEISALIKSRRKITSIIVIRINKRGNLAMARPCPVCMLAIKEAKLKYIEYSDESGRIIREKLL